MSEGNRKSPIEILRHYLSPIILLVIAVFTIISSTGAFGNVENPISLCVLGLLSVFLGIEYIFLLRSIEKFNINLEDHFSHDDDFARNVNEHFTKVELDLKEINDYIKKSTGAIHAISYQEFWSNLTKLANDATMEIKVFAIGKNIQAPNHWSDVVANRDVDYKVIFGMDADSTDSSFAKRLHYRSKKFKKDTSKSQLNIGTIDIKHDLQSCLVLIDRNHFGMAFGSGSDGDIKSGFILEDSAQIAGLVTSWYDQNIYPNANVVTAIGRKSISTTPFHLITGNKPIAIENEDVDLIENRNISQEKHEKTPEA